MARPLEDSKRGDNTTLVNCGTYGGHRHYAVCCHIVERSEKGQVRSSDVACARSVANGECPARKMRLEERKAGESLYFTPRDQSDLYKDKPTRPPLDVLNPSYQRGWDTAGRMLAKGRPVERGSSTSEVKRAALAPKSTSRPTPASTGNLYADLVNKLMAERGGAK